MDIVTRKTWKMTEVTKMGAIGRSSIVFDTQVYILDSGSVVGQMEKEGPLGELFDEVGSDTNDMFGEDTWEKAESMLQQKAIDIVLQKTKLRAKDIRYLFAGDLLGQTIASSFGVLDFQIPFFGLFGACSTCGESLSLGSMTVAAGFAESVLCVTSSHFASAQKEFRFPLEYGGQRPLYASWTVTGSAGFVLQSEAMIKNGKKKPKAKITGITTGKIVDFGIKDSFNMGCAMAPAAMDVIYTHFQDFGTKPNDYDAIITGDLGQYGREALIKLLREKKLEAGDKLLDCGLLMYDTQKQDVHAGGSGCGCSATVLSAYLLRKIEKGEWNKILFVPTGALLNKVSFNEGQNIPGIAHAVLIESCN